MNNTPMTKITATALPMPMPALSPADNPEDDISCEVGANDGFAVGMLVDARLVPVIVVATDEEISVDFEDNDDVFVTADVPAAAVKNTAAFPCISDNRAATKSPLAHPAAVSQALFEQHPRKGCIVSWQVYHFAPLLPPLHAWASILL